MDEATVRTVRDRYPWASWAVWVPAFPDAGCIEETPERLFEFIIDRREQLTPDIVLTGLNRADDLPGPFANFHSPNRLHYDHRLKEFIQDGGLDRLAGAYMTDLVDTVDPDSKRVGISPADAETFLEQLDLLDEPVVHVVCFGTKPFEGLVNRFDAEPTEGPHEILSAQTTARGRPLHLYRIWFYGAWGQNQEKVPILEDQLCHLNKSIDRDALTTRK